MGTKILVFIPAYGNQISVATFAATHGLLPALMAKGIGGGVATFSYPEVSEVRNIAVTCWYDTLPDATHLLFIDADMGFEPQLVLDMLTFNEPMVGAIYSKKVLPIQWAASGLGEGKFAERRGDFMKVAGLGMGVFLIRRDAIDKMVAAYPELIDTRMELHAAKDMLTSGRLLRLFDPMDNPNSGRMSEDLSFCHRWAAIGGEIWASVGHTVDHVGQYSYRSNYLQFIAEKHAAEAQQSELSIAAE